MQGKGDDLPELLPISHYSPAEEEAAAVLLAEFGVSGPYDDLLNFTTASTCVFAHGGRDVFLTGAPHGDVDDDNETIPTGKTIDDVDHTWPLECVVLHHTNILSSITAAPLWEGVNEVLDGNDGATNPVLLRELLVSETTDPVSVDYSQVPQTVPENGDDVQILETLDELLHEADLLLTKRRPFVDPMSEVSILERQRAVAEEERCWTPISDIGNDDDDDNGDTVSNINTELMENLRKAEKERESRPTLFAYEFGPTLEEQHILSEWDEAVVRCEQQVDVSARDVLLNIYEIIDTSKIDEVTNNENQMQVKEQETVVHSRPPLWEEEQKIVLESIATMETRDSELETAASERVQQAREERHHHPRRVPPGQLVLDNFMTRIDAIVPPIPVEVQVRTMVAENKDEESEMQTYNNGKQDDKQQSTILELKTENYESSSLEQIQKRVERECFMVRCEAYEARRMQEEDDKIASELQWLEEEAKRIEDSIQKCLDEEEESYKSIIAEEITTYQELYKEKEKHFIMMKENERQRKLNDVAKLSDGFIKEHARIRYEIMTLEESLVKNIIQEEREEREMLQHKQEQNITLIVKSVAKWITAVLGKDPHSPIGPINAQELAVQTINAAWQSWTACSSPPAVSGAALRLRALRDERRVGGEWQRAGGRAVEETAVALTEAVRPSTPPAHEELRPLSPIPVSNSNADFNSNSNSNSISNPVGVRLDAARAKQLQPITLGGAVNPDKRQLAQLCHSLSFALEEINELDLASLATLTVGGTRVAPLVKELDFGGNALRTLPLDGLLRVFTELQRLSVNDNGLCNVAWRSAAAAARGVAEAHANAIARASRITHLDLSLNALQNIEAVGKLLSYHLRSLVIYANRIESLLPLESCMHLESLEASRNCVSSLAELEKLSLLQTVDLSENRITNFEPLSSRVLLQNLCLSRNQIQSFPKTVYLGFLRQLFISENRIEVISSDSFLWLPLLSSLHLENNKLRDLSGLAHCPRLTTVSVAFNQIQRVEDLLPLTACKKLQSLSVIENPFLCNSDKDSSKQISLELKEKLLRWFPHLSELNNEKIGKDEHEKSFWNETEELRYLFISRRLRKQQQENIIDGIGFWSGSFVGHNDIRQMCGEFDSYSLYKSPIFAYADMFASLSSDVALTRIQMDQDVLTTMRRRHYHDALHIEDELRERLGKSKQRLNPVVHRLSDKVEERNRRDAILSMQRDLKSLQTAHVVKSNMFIRTTLYHEKAQAYRESRAKIVICDWMQRWMLVKRAKKELESLKLSKSEEQRRRYEKAARIIQPIWRGAALRSRLKRILHPDGADDDDDDKFAHVSLDFLDSSETAPGGKNGSSGVGAVLQSVLQAHASPPNFQVSSNSGIARGFNGIVNSASVFDGILSQRASSATGMRPTHTNHLEEKQRPESQPQIVQGPLSTPSEPPVSPSRTDGEWGALVSSQLRKKQRKMERAHRENMEREFMKDPLKVKRAMGKR
ncbi:uncharacterized protein TM35_000072710 [Trypanosoma theileri]|uniref:Leucine-rich repeat protein (LRRP) n=1 Tax=Trypanosoma theileri TaxID=67003 RepID=A0A1X0P1N9_9TRYP|nr:uncharacterized protein TM35_000072710 [Trypanosoma theileri]ORC90847.1 hypothetical protein TM35_000072710 [Trypanosoma theileri]